MLKRPPILMNTIGRTLLRRRVTNIAQANEISERVGLTVSGDSKESERLYVMNVKRPTQRVFADSAKLAFVPIAPSRIARLPEPACAVVARMTSEPCGVSIAAPVFGLPLAKTGVITKSHLPGFACAPWWTRNGRVAVGARLSDAFNKSGVRGSDESTIEGRRHACARAIVNVAPSIARWSMKRCPTVRARDRFVLPLISLRGNVQTAPNLGGPRVDVCAPRLLVFVWHPPLYGARVGIGAEGCEQSRPARTVRNLAAATKESAQDDLFAETAAA